jgi:hypothetical protein
MIDDKLIQKMLEGVEYLRDGLEKIQASNEKPKIEPQAGDVWMYDNDCIFVYKDAQLGLRYIWGSGLQINRSAQDKLREYPATRIFSLSEYLKNKEAGDA